MTPRERETYRLHARMPGHRRQVDRARQIVERAVAEVPGRWAASISGGKDSICLAHLLCQTSWDGPFFHYRTAEIPEANTELVRRIARRMNRELIVKEIYGDWDFWEEKGRVILSASTEEDRKALAKHDRRYRESLESAVEDVGAAGMFIGMRADESGNRRRVVKTRGPLYFAASREQWACLPLAYWTGRDVWAYLLENDLPWLGRYDKSEDREQERSEVTFIWGQNGDDIWSSGQAARIRDSDPEEWIRLCHKFPKLRDYT